MSEPLGCNRFSVCADSQAGFIRSARGAVASLAGVRIVPAALGDVINSFNPDGAAEELGNTG